VYDWETGDIEEFEEHITVFLEKTVNGKRNTTLKSAVLMED
jgi:hypothetical protein